MNYVPNTDDDRRLMLEVIGVNSIDDLFLDIPEDLRIARLNVADGLTELDLTRHMRSIAAKNANLDDYASFLGAGAYDHFLPSVVTPLILRGEFSTAYTPYQPEVSQGTLQAVYEYQTMICALTGMAISNASMYDGASAFAEAALVALNTTRGISEIVVAKTVHPEYRATLATYLRGRDVTIKEIPYDDATGTIDIAALEDAVSDKTAGVLVQYPNFFGALEPMTEIGEIAHKAGAQFVVAVNPISMGLLKPPGEYDADIVVGEGHALGNPIAFGGPYLGFFAVSEKLIRRIPGRLSGETTDVDGRRACVLTLRAREQDIRREKATSNICTNQALNALAACVYLAAVGKEGMREVATLNAQKAHYALGQLSVNGFESRFDAPFFNEFVVKYPSDVETLNEALLDEKIIGGLPLGRFYPELSDCALVAVTEMRTREQIDAMAATLKQAASV